MQSIRRITGLHAMLDEADAFLIDQFGTLHDGVSLYPRVTEGMARLRASGKRVVILSNSGKRSRPNVDRLAAIGLPSEHYDGFLSSGEVAWRLLAETASSGPGLGAPVLGPVPWRGRGGAGWS